MNLNQVVSDVFISKVCSIKADKDSTESKQVTLKVKFDGVILRAVFDKAVSGAVIQWQNGPGRSKYDQWKSDQVVKIDFKAPGRAPAINPEEAMRTKLSMMTKIERRDYIESMLDEVDEIDEDEEMIEDEIDEDEDEDEEIKE